MQTLGDMFWLISEHLDHLIQQIQYQIGSDWIRQVPGPKIKLILFGPRLGHPRGRQLNKYIYIYIYIFSWQMIEG